MTAKKPASKSPRKSPRKATLSAPKPQTTTLELKASPIKGTPYDPFYNDDTLLEAAKRKETAAALQRTKDRREALKSVSSSPFEDMPEHEPVCKPSLLDNVFCGFVLISLLIIGFVFVKICLLS